MADILDFPVPNSSRSVLSDADPIFRALRPQTERLRQQLCECLDSLEVLDGFVRADPALAALLPQSARVRELIAVAETKLANICCDELHDKGDS